MSNGWFAKNDYLLPSQMESNAKLFINYFRNLKWADTAIAAMLGNIQAESGVNPGIWAYLDAGNPKGAYGLVQWHYPNKFFDWMNATYGPAADPLDGTQQCARIKYESDNGLQWLRNDNVGWLTPYGDITWEMFISGGELKTLTTAFFANYEHPIETTPAVAQRRYENARAWLDFMGAVEPVSEFEGVDVSEFQEEINWAEVAKTKSFAIIRAGYTGTESGNFYIDPTARENIKGAKAAGLRVGLYWFGVPKKSTTARAEAKFCTQFAKEFPPGTIELPIFYDLEGNNEGSQTARFVQGAVKSFCREVQRAGFSAGLYYNYDYMSRYYPEKFFADNPTIKRWHAWPDSGTKPPSEPWDFWQYSWKGRVPGIPTVVDLDKMVGDPNPPPPPFPPISAKMRIPLDNKKRWLILTIKGVVENAPR